MVAWELATVQHGERSRFVRATRGFNLAQTFGRDHPMQDFRRLKVWNASVELVASVYNATDGMPSSERFGLSSQMRSASVSICSNIAEGCGRATSADFARFLNVSFASACELESQIVISERVGLIDSEVVRRLEGDVVRIKTQLVRLRDSVARAGRRYQRSRADASGDREPRTDN
jgi:four helix bundle protein